MARRSGRGRGEFPPNMGQAGKFSGSPFPVESHSSGKIAARYLPVNDLLFLSTFPPRQCGIATFTDDVVRSVEQQAPHTSGSVIAVHDSGGPPCLYPRRVTAKIEQHQRAEYRQAAAFINHHPAPVLNIQHEFGIFGGPHGAWLLDLLQEVKKPVALTLHTVLPAPTFEHRKFVRDLCERAAKVIVLSETARRFLDTQYFIDRQYVEVIPHGVPDVPFVPTAQAKRALDLDGRFVVSTFGLLSRGKGLELALDAIAGVAERYPQVLYVILGATHPNIRQIEGEAYRSELQARIGRMGLSRNVLMVNRYLALEDLIQYILATDVYVTPYRNEAQIVSGTLAYALGAGKPVVSTPYFYARELLDDGRGMLVPFNDGAAMTRSLLALAADEHMRGEMAARAYAFGRSMIWSVVGGRYARLFERLAARAQTALA